MEFNLGMRNLRVTFASHVPETRWGGRGRGGAPDTGTLTALTGDAMRHL
jgi:hypothetical protein